ncbi:MAG: hypothetical protein NTV52_31115 [Acidobacteria bacterium]|nr:hypothetical protein [Acidobacteriota bacterium]
MDQQIETGAAGATEPQDRKVLERDAVKGLINGMGLKSEPAAAHLLSQTARVMGSDITKPDCLLLVSSLMLEIRPTSAIEAMLAVQMVAVHEAAMRLLTRAASGAGFAEAADADIRGAQRLLRLFADQTETLQRLKGKTGQQRMTVEHVHVHQGGQAIVGAVSLEKLEAKGGVR